MAKQLLPKLMRLVVDASVLVAELLRMRGRALVAHPQLDLFLAADTFSETAHELRRRVAQLERHGQVTPEEAEQLLDGSLSALDLAVSTVPSTLYVKRSGEALRRIPRDPNDVPTVALALALDCGIWTTDNDFLGCGLPVWTTETLLLHLETLDSAP